MLGMKVHFIRHGEVESHFRERFHLGSEAELSSKGRREAHVAGEWWASKTLMVNLL
jgi:broad specificity phosphatase PhoE